MIQKQKCLFYFVGDVPFKSLEDAQKADLVKLVPTDWITQPKFATETAEVIADWLLANKEALVDCLTTTPTSRLKARKSHGAVRKPRKPKNTVAVVPERSEA